jgi:hypothetical protein
MFFSSRKLTVSLTPPAVSLSLLRSHALRAGEAPFGNSEKQSKFEIFNRITESPVRLPFLMSLNLKTLIKGLLEKKPDKRFCFDEVAKCSWLKDVSRRCVLLVAVYLRLLRTLTRWKVHSKALYYQRML